MHHDIGQCPSVQVSPHHSTKERLQEDFKLAGGHPFPEPIHSSIGYSGFCPIPLASFLMAQLSVRLLATYFDEDIAVLGRQVGFEDETTELKCLWSSNIR